MVRRWSFLVLLVGCPPVPEPAIDLPDDPLLYMTEVGYRRAILERDLTEQDNTYAQERLARYAIEGSGWEILPEHDPASRPLGSEDVEALVAGGGAPWLPGFAAPLEPDRPPETEGAWVELGRRVFFEYPFRVDDLMRRLALLPGALVEVGFLWDGAGWVGLRAVEGDNGALGVGLTCAQCHASLDPEGGFSGRIANRAMDIGRARLLAQGLDSEELPSEIESSDIDHLALLGPGRADLLADGVFNPYAYPDFGGLRDLPYLHHTANWFHRGTATLAVRCETLFVTGNLQHTRPPRVLAWALAAYLRNLEPPPPLTGPSPQSEAGQAVFEAAGCPDCHEPPIFTSDRRVSVEEIGTDPAAGLSAVRSTGDYRIPSLRGVGRLAPYLHDGAFPDLESMFDPQREEPGHEQGLELDAEERELLLAYLRSI